MHVVGGVRRADPNPPTPALPRSPFPELHVRTRRIESARTVPLEKYTNARRRASGESVSEVAALPGAAVARPGPANAGRVAPAATPILVQGRAASRWTAQDSVLLVFELAGLWGLNKVGYIAVARLRIPLPGNVAAMLLLFGLLCAGIVPERLFARSSTLLARHLAFFFVPIAVGLMNLGGLVLSQGWQLLIVLVASAAAGLCATGWMAQLLSRTKRAP